MSAVLLLLVCSVLLCGALCAATCIGIGTFVSASFGAGKDVVEMFWLGLAAVVCILEFYHLVRPIDSAVGLALLAIGLAGFFVYHAPYRILRETQQASAWTVFAYIAMLALIALRSASPCEFFDTGLYGAQTVRWLATYPAVPGLANLQGRLGFNSSVLMCMAVLRHGMLAPLTYRVFDGLLVAVLLAPVLAAIRRIVRGISNSTSDWFATILLMPLVYRIFESSETANLVGTDTDLPANLVCLAAIWYLFSALQEHASSSGMRRAEEEEISLRSALLCANVLFSLATVFKLSMAILAGLGWLLAFIEWRLAAKRSGNTKPLGDLAFLAIPVAIIVPWIAQGLIISGYPFYPSSLFGIPMDWRVPASSVNLVEAGVRSWARMPHATLTEAAGHKWIGVWFHSAYTSRAEFLFPIMITIVGSLFLLWPANSRESRRNYQGLWLLVPLALALVFWFVEAPALRFAQAALWGTACICGGYGISRFVEKHPE